jgi:hypothetical protein
MREMSIATSLVHVLSSPAAGPFRLFADEWRQAAGESGRVIE